MKMAKKWTALLFAAVFLALGTATPALALDLTQEPNINDYFDATLVPDVYDETINVAVGGSIQAAIDQAVTNREQGKSTKILLADGIYRETVNLNDNTHNAADSQPFITVEAAPNATPVISGALPVTGWVKAGDGTYTASLTDEMINLLTDNGA
ncbi:MAG: hypothetical protein LBC83_00040, partial [Oscillospiraceae bacterium]|nr:hypothetical protein [Oscillospiraceae bacterium]